jgi:DNA ligase-1
MSFKAFANMVLEIASSTKNTEKEEALTKYFRQAPNDEKIWALSILVGRKIKKPFTSTQMKQWCIEAAKIPSWLFEECYLNVGDLSETISLLLPDELHADDSTLKSQFEFLQGLSLLPDDEKKNLLIQKWLSMDKKERFVFNKLVSGNFRMGVSSQMVIHALSKLLHVEPAQLSYRLSGNWSAENNTFDELVAGSTLDADASKPYPFYLAYALDVAFDALGSEEEWLAEWKWDGIRGQMVHRHHEFFLWSRGEELITEKFPELQTIKNVLPSGMVLDGEIVSFKNGKPLPFQSLQTRIGRKNITKKILDDYPAAFIVYDVLEWQGSDIRLWELSKRRAVLEKLFTNHERCGIYPTHPKFSSLLLSPLIPFSSWHELAALRADSRCFLAEGIMLKRKTSVYQVGRRRGDWWKWKVEPMSVDAVLVAAQKGHGRRANLYTDYTFAVWKENELITFAKAYSGLTDKEFMEVDAFIRRNTIEKFGPVRTVKPELVFEIGFDGIAESKRHKCGVAVRFPRILRWRKDKKIEEANTMDDLKQLLKNFQ